MDKRDLRIYYYEGGQLLKINHGNKLHRARTEEEVSENILKWISKNYNNKNTQFVVIEFFSSYNSKIINVIEPMPE